VSDAVFGEFIWDTTKAARNEDKHGVSFVEATQVFEDNNALVRDDGNNNGNLIAIGYSRAQRILCVVHCERGEFVRIISARKATRAEARDYRG